MSYNVMNTPVLLVGTGPMAEAYAKVLQAMSVETTVVGRGTTSCQNFSKSTGLIPFEGGIEKFLRANTVRSDVKAIVAVGTESLMEVLLALVNHGIRSVLVEKPGAISIEELLREEQKLKDVDNDIYVGYNRRFYQSVKEALRLISEDGGLTGVHFEFTEWAHKIAPLKKFPGVKENWFFANSTHVVDLAFFFGGKPAEWKNYKQSGTLNWHSQSAFAGAGITDRNVLFSYMANWESAGRWALELLTKERRIYLRPIELLHIQTKGTVDVVKHEFDSSIDEFYKPGIYEMVKAFLQTPEVTDSRLLNFREQVWMAKFVYEPIIH